jgi:hypothetical protein
MDHIFPPVLKMPPDMGGIVSFLYPELLGLLVLADLVGNAAAGLASGLARSLAFAAAAVFGALAKITGLNGLNMLHIYLRA